MPSATSPAPYTHPDIPPFPSPQTFSLTPEIYHILSRLALAQTPTTNTNPTIPTATSPPTPSSSQPNNPLSLQPLETKDLPTAIYPIRQRITKAREAIKALPDVERSVREQEEEMRWLEERVRGLRGRLGELGGLAGEGLRSDDGQKEGEMEVIER